MRPHMKHYFPILVFAFSVSLVWSVDAAVDFSKRTIDSGNKPAANSGKKATPDSKTGPPAPLTRGEIQQKRRDEVLKNRSEIERQKNEAELEKARAELAEKMVREKSVISEAARAEQNTEDQKKNDKIAKNAANERAIFNTLTGRFTDEVDEDSENDLGVFRTEAQQGLPQDWDLLFDGKTFIGWKTQTKGPYAGGRFTIDDGMICSNPAYPGLIYTTGQFGDVSLEFEIKAKVGSIAYLLFRTSPDPKNLESSCYAIVIATDSDSKTCGSILGHQDCPGFPIVLDSKEIENGEHPWRKFRISSSDSWIKVDYDKMVENSYYAPTLLRRGFIGFLVTKGAVKIRNIYWNQSQAHSMYDGKSLTGWKASNENPAFKAQVKDSLLNVYGGPGAIESIETFDNFVLNLEFRVNHSNSDSGVLFRCVPGLSGAGYECQLIGIPSEDDRNKFVGIETGSLFRLANGRKVPSNIRKWNTLTVSAVDNHFQIWVNGAQTLDHSDRRPAVSEKDINPRNGLKLSGGPIQIEGHNTSTNIDFRNITIYDVPPRREIPK